MTEYWEPQPENYFPEADELEAEDIYALTVDPDNGLNIVAERLKTSRDNLLTILKRDPNAIDLIRAAESEFESFVHLRLRLLTPEAIEALEDVMRGGGNEKMASARVKAAEAVMDRTFLPKISRIQQSQDVGLSTSGLPSLDELINTAHSPDEAFSIVQRHQEVMREIEALRQGAKEIIDVRPEDKTASAN